MHVCYFQFIQYIYFIPYPPEDKPPPNSLLDVAHADWGRSIFFNMQFTSNISPPRPVVCPAAVA